MGTNIIYIVVAMQYAIFATNMQQMCNIYAQISPKMTTFHSTCHLSTHQKNPYVDP